MPPPAVPARESLGGVLGVSFGLILVVLGVVSLVVGRVGELDPEETLRTHFDYDSLPYGFVAAKAQRLPRGDTLIALRGPDWKDSDGSDPAGADPDREDPGGEESGDDLADAGRDADESAATGGESGRPAGGSKGKDEHSWVDWSKIPIGAAGEPPVEAVLIDYPLSVAEEVLKREFSIGDSSGGGGGGSRRRRGGGGGGGGGGSFVGSDGGTSTIDSGRLDWHGLGPAYLHQRRYTQDGGRPTFFDRVRVNLSLGGRCRVLYLRWPERAPASREGVEAALLALRPLPADLELLEAQGG